VHVGLPEDDEEETDPADRLNSLARIAALLTIAGDVAETSARTTVRGEPDVISNGAVLAQGSTNEQEILLSNVGGGTFTLRFKGAVAEPNQQSPLGEETEAIDHDADAATIKAALVALAGINENDLEVERFGDRIVVRFTEGGQYAKTPMHVFGVSAANLTPAGQTTLNVRGTDDEGVVWALLTQTTLTGMGMPVFNAIQTIFVDDPQPGQPLRKFQLSYEGATTGDMDLGMNAAEIGAALEALETIGAGNVSVAKTDKVIVVRFEGALTNRAVESFTSERRLCPHSGARGRASIRSATRRFRRAPTASARNDIRTLTVDATGGSFVLEINDGTTAPIAYNATAAEVREALQRLLPDRFADDIAVLRFGMVYHIQFQGLLRAVMGGPGAGPLFVDAAGLTGGGATIATRMDGINYYGIDTLNVGFGPAGQGGHVLNVQGALASTTNIGLNQGDNRIFVSSDADLDHATLFPDGAKFGFDFLTGHLDLIAGDLNIDAGEGRHQLMVSDEATPLAKGTDANPVLIQRPATDIAAGLEVLSSIEIEMLGWAGGAIRYGAPENANFFDGITLWGGAKDNVFHVDATHQREAGPFSTLTTLSTGIGDDAARVTLEAGTDGHFVLNAQEGDDWIDARGATLPLVLIGHDGDDMIFGGDGGDIVFGDRGRIIFQDGDTETTVIGHGGRFDFTDGRLGLPNVIRSILAEADAIVLEGGRDVIIGGDGDDLLIGGSNSDVIDGGKGRDLIVGNNAELDRRTTQDKFVNPRFRALTGTQIYATAENQSGELLIDRFNSYADPDWAGSPPVWGDLVLTLHDGLTLPSDGDATLTQGDNYLAGGADDDMIFGGRGNATIQGDGSIFWDVWQGHGNRAILGGWIDLAGLDPLDPNFNPNRAEFDRADLDLLAQLTARPLEPQALPRSFEAASDGDDYIEGGSGNSVIFGNLGQNDIIGGNSNMFGLAQSSQRTNSGANIIFGGAGTRIDRNDLGYDAEGGLVSFADRHARNASVILGDNGNIVRLVGTNEADSGANLGFNYDANDPTRGDLHVKARGVDLLDYERWELAPAAAVPDPSRLCWQYRRGRPDPRRIRR
jgi:Ca2+-binding RTX toxin-like protein